MIALSRHPLWSAAFPDWALWRRTYAADEEFLENYLKRFSNREDPADFKFRKDVTPIPGFAGAAIDKIKNSIFQRLADVLRIGGSDAYQQAVEGRNLGVDRRGSSMNAFLGQKVLPDALIMGKVGVYIDNSVSAGPLSIDEAGTPYIYPYCVEDICNWRETGPDQPSEYQSIVLRDMLMDYDEVSRMPTGTVVRYRHVWLNSDGRVMVQFYNHDDTPASIPRELALTRIPFVLVNLQDSLIRKVCRHQVALLNLTSSDVSYALRSNHPFYVEQQDLSAAGGHLKKAATDGSANAGEGTKGSDIEVGASHGRIYGKGMDSPGFIAPPSEPLEASMRLQDKLERDILRLVNLAVSQLGQQSAESKGKDNEGLEAGLSFIGLVLQSAESKIAEHWAAYESLKPSARQVALVKYPDRYSLKTDSERIEESENLSKLLYTIPGRKAKQEIAKLIVRVLLNGKVRVDVISTIEKEIDDSDYLTSDPKTIVEAVKAGLCGEKTGSMALGFTEDEYKQARKDHADRVKRILESQGGPNGGTNGAARGAPDLSGSPDRAATAEKQETQNTDTEDTTKDRIRGEGK